MMFGTTRNRSLTACCLAAAFAVAPLAIAQNGPPPQQKVPPLPRMQEDLKAGKDTVKEMGMDHMAGSMKADHVVNGQLMKYAQSPDSTGDQCFALKAAGGNMTEIEASKVIVAKATDPKIKELAQTILDEHQKAQNKLAPIAKKLGVVLPDSLPSMHQADVTSLKNASPEMAQKAYLGMMKADHLKAVSMYTDKAPVLKDADLKAYATETLPHIRAHTAKILMTADSQGMPLDLKFQDMAMPGE